MIYLQAQKQFKEIQLQVYSKTPLESFIKALKNLIKMIALENISQFQQYITFIGIDIGGTSSKIAVLTNKTLESIKNEIQVTLPIKNQNFRLFTHTVNSIEQLLTLLQELKKEVGENIKLCGTGGGTMLRTETIKQLLGVKVVPLSEFQAHARGLQLYKNAGFPIRQQLYSKKSQNEIIVTMKQTLLKDYKQLLFMSLGSGVNFQMYGQGEKGFERQKAKDIQLSKTGDGYFLEGTSLGAGFIMGVGKLCTGETEYPNILSKLKEQSGLRQFYEGFFVNLFQMAINMVLLHQRYNLIFSGKLLCFQQNYSNFFVEALKQMISIQQIEISILSLTVLQGFLGAIGAVQNLLDE